MENLGKQGLERFPKSDCEWFLKWGETDNQVYGVGGEGKCKLIAYYLYEWVQLQHRNS